MKTCPVCGSTLHESSSVESSIELDSKDDYLQYFSQYPRLCATIEKWWHDDAVLALWMNYYLQETRGNSRHGFPMDVAEQILKLYNKRRVKVEEFTSLDLVKSKIKDTDELFRG